MELQAEKINRLADIIENCEEVGFRDRREGDTEPSFTMFEISYPCGAPACLLGHHNVLEGRDPHDGTADMLALGPGNQPRTSTRSQHAAARLRRLSKGPEFFQLHHRAARRGGSAQSGRRRRR